MKKIIALLLASVMCLSGCTSNTNTNKTEESTSTETTSEKTETSESSAKDLDWDSLDDEESKQYLVDSIQANLENDLGSDDYKINEIYTSYVSKEYLEEIDYNSQSNIWFGYTIDEIDEAMGDTQYVFTMDENNNTEVIPFEAYTDDTNKKILKNVAIGSGVILVLTSLSVVTASAGVVTVSVALTTSGAAAGATSGAALGAGTAFVLTTIVESIKTGKLDSETLKSGLVGASEGFKFGAIIGAAHGGRQSFVDYKIASSTSSVIPAWQDSEKMAQSIFGGREQISFLDGEEVAQNTAGAVRPDLVDDAKKVAYEVKNYDLKNNFGLLKSELNREVGERVINLPSGYTQKIVLDVRNRGYSRAFLKSVRKGIQNSLKDIYPDIAIQFIK